MTDLFGVTLPEMIRELEREIDELRDSPRYVGGPWLDLRRIEVLTATIARLKRGAAEAA